jgi:hypothetical protein
MNYVNLAELHTYEYFLNNWDVTLSLQRMLQ